MEIVFTKQAVKDFEKIKENQALHTKVIALLELLEKDSFIKPPSFEKLIGINNTFSRRINLQYRLVYQVIDDKNVVKIIRMWTHYDNL